MNWTFDIVNEKNVERSEDAAENLEPGILLKGLLLNGATWDYENNFLSETVNKNLHCPMPHIIMRPSNFVFASDYQDFFLCPVFTNCENEPLLYIPLNPGANAAGHWTRIGVTMLTKLN
ncbi:dynein axonemal heavy chain 3-like [Neocloeon triangulifer]|uniref:dynein axonemal heavy chain 3-like n=1 Tax=Neocloeon triangulifer TaxID=2078957 RepID=UPI00286FACD4|nr:dynein axonemal heavy chain 3-like [Neocloeon triangulifer]